MLRRAFWLVPLAAAAAAGAGALLRQPVVALVVGTALGVACAFVLSVGLERRVDHIAGRIRRFATGGELDRDTIKGSRAWRRLVNDLVELAESLQQRSEELTSERARVERLLDTLPTAILLFDRSGLSYANPAAQSLFGVGRRHSRSPFQVLGVEGLADAVAEARETGRSVDVEVQRSDRNLTAHAAVTGEDVVALLVTDVTDSRRLEQVRRDFVTNASHELKTPVAGMQALAESLGLAIDRDPGRARSMIVRMQIEATRLGKLVRELLDLARLEEDAAAQSGSQRVDLADVARVQGERLRPLADSRGVTLRYEAPEPAPLVAQPADLRLIAANLIENAVRYNRPGGYVKVRVHRRPPHVVLEVEDNGLGIPDVDQDRVFERFYRVDKARSRAAGGTGLGLSIVRHAAERHGGEVSVDSVLGEGSTFRVTLPVEGSRAVRG